MFTEVVAAMGFKACKTPNVGFKVLDVENLIGVPVLSVFTTCSKRTPLYSISRYTRCMSVRALLLQY